MTLLLDRHAVIEASAGTGKTYTIEGIVVDLLANHGLTIDQILLVTFTEKAAGDLRARLRTRLVTVACENPALRIALDQFDQAPIFTIHAFCQRVLQDYALEQGIDFQHELVNDQELLPMLLADVQRKNWAATFGDRLEVVLRKANYHRESAQAWNDNVLDVARQYLPESGHGLRPAPIPDWWLQDDLADASHQLVVSTLGWLCEELRRYKIDRGLISFNDMLVRLNQSLDPSRGGALAKLLRERFRVAIVDEFQDTDPIQWSMLQRVFLAENGKLIVVGDPKQAIFEFRSGDLPTYLTATRTLVETHDAHQFPLTTNWRSDPRLLEALNRLFEASDWFSAESGITYRRVDWPDTPVSKIVEDRSDRPALIGIDMGKQRSPSTAKQALAAFIGHEIENLLWGDDGKPALKISRKDGVVRSLTADDLCILVFKRDEANALCTELDRRHIPYSFYKKSGLWESAEADLLRMILKTLREPDSDGSFRRALLTDFFRIPPHELARAGNFPATHPIRRLYRKWADYAAERDWPTLFQSLLEETGILAHYQTAEDSDRRLANLRFLTNQLEQTGISRNLDLLGLLQWMDETAKAGQGEADYQPIETERPKVKIMTVHASKGLEFPIVFLAGGYTDRAVKNDNKPAASLVLRGERNERIFHFAATPEDFERRTAEQHQEKRRLLYVALTRPIFKLYVPLLSKPQYGATVPGPLISILNPAWAASDPAAFLPDAAATVPVDVSLKRPIIRRKLEGDHSPQGASQTPPANVNEKRLAVGGPLFPEIDPGLHERRILIRSYSSIHRQHVSHQSEKARFTEIAKPNPDETPDTPDGSEPLRGPVFGDLIHRILQEISFEEVGRAKKPRDLWRMGTRSQRMLADLLAENLPQLTPRNPPENFEELAKDQIARLVWFSLHTPIPQIELPLWKVPATDRLHELEFLFPEREAKMGGREGFLTGLMDLVFRHAGKFYLLDWKTNRLPSYDSESIKSAMAEADYHRQYRLYLQALSKWFDARQVNAAPNSSHAHGKIERLPSLELFGGVYYLFIRGMNGEKNSPGIFFHKPQASDFRLEAVLTESHG